MLSSKTIFQHLKPEVIYHKKLQRMAEKIVYIKGYFMAIGKVIRVIRKHNGLSQREFAGMVGISQTSLALLETSKTFPRDETILKMAEVFDTHPLLIKIAGIGLQLYEEREKTFRTAFPDFNERALALILRR
ncbi:helix-turn-helix domain-containing protein [Chitinophaga varians]|uniref:helix-turn-helix domain-containing protein n=1 Tax=Chitinophaga varians TaxID=2202339 RepID=UPI00165F2802|nr:helix-turn-helix transcriptional regulator [Chitinophaga varians]MBC9909134.1 helix-turn-helix transcriptional regulator [Chitinophaga varians]